MIATFGSILYKELDMPCKEPIKLNNRSYLKTVKEMDYQEFHAIITSLFYNLRNKLITSSDYIQFQSSSDDYQSVPYDIASQYEYPIVINNVKSTGKKQKIMNTINIEFQGYAPSCIVDYIVDNRNPTGCDVLYLPVVIESFGEAYNDNDIYHQMLLVIDFEKRTAFLFDPNGKESRYGCEEVHNLFEKYIVLINELLDYYGRDQITYERRNGTRLNKELPCIGGHNCVICCILFMVFHNSGYNIEDTDSYNDKTLLTFHLVLFNVIGKTLNTQK
jgi:hypothetical protein